MNSFNDTLFHRYNVIEGQPIEAGARSIFHNVYFQPPSLRYIGLRKLSRQPCGLINNAYLSCDKDGDMFFNDDHNWDFNINPNIMDLLLGEMAEAILQLHADNSYLFELAQTNPTLFACVLLHISNPISCIVDEFIRKSAEMRLDGLYTATDAAINYTLRYLWDEADHNWEQLMNDFETSKYEYRLVNYTTWSVGDNILSKTGVRKSLSYCTNYTLTYPNNLVNLDASDSSLGFLHCGFDPGNTYLTN